MGTLALQPDRRLVRVEEGTAWPLRHVHPTAHGSPGPRATGTQPSQQPDASCRRLKCDSSMAPRSERHLQTSQISHVSILVKLGECHRPPVVHWPLSSRGFRPPVHSGLAQVTRPPPAAQVPENAVPSPVPVRGWRCTTMQAITAATATIASAMNGNSLEGAGCPGLHSSTNGTTRVRDPS